MATAQYIPLEKLHDDIVIHGAYDQTFAWLYPGMLSAVCRERYEKLLEGFHSTGHTAALIVSASGRTEIGGNHTDHQHGNVLAAAVELDFLCICHPNNDGVIRVQSDGYPMDTIHLNDLSAKEEERGRSSSLIRGIASWFLAHGAEPFGFDAYTVTDVLGGSGLSSSAAFEVGIGTAMNLLWNCGKSSVEIAIAGQYAENTYFGKPSGLMDQMASSVGGFIQIDFEDTANPRIRPISFDLSAYGYHLCIVDTKGDHADLTADYAAIPAEMEQVARFFGKEYLRQVDEAEFKRNVWHVRALAGDRAVLRAIHFFQDNRLAVDTANALESGDIRRFLDNTIQSGRSSFTCLQNIYSPGAPLHQGLSLALTLSESILRDQGAWRVHGGGFAGTIQAFVPDSLLEQYRQEMDAVFGRGCCHVLSIRPIGAVEITPHMYPQRN